MSTNSSTVPALLSSTTPPPTTFLTSLLKWWLVNSDYICQQVLPIICWWITTILMSILLYCYRFRPNLLRVKSGSLSTPMLVFMANHLLNTTVCLFSHHVLNWAVGKISHINDSNWLNTWWSFWFQNYINVAPLSVLFIVMDRWLSLKMSFRYTKRAQLYLGWTNLSAMALHYAFTFLNVMIAWPYDKMCLAKGTENNPIANRACLPLFNRIVNFTQQALKFAFAFLNIGMSAIFLQALLKANVANVRNGIVKMTILLELVFDAIPAVLSLLFSALQFESINLNVYLFLMVSSDAALCSVVYTKQLFNVFHPTKRTQQPVRVSATINTLTLASL